MENNEREETTRRDFIHKVSVGLVTLTTIVPWVAEMATAGGGDATNTLASLKINDHPELQQVGGHFILKRTPVGDLLIIRSGSDQYSAMSVVCPHLKCDVKVRKNDLIQCPCHQSGYKLDGSYISGPAKKGLTTFPLAVEGGMLTIMRQS